MLLIVPGFTPLLGSKATQEEALPFNSTLKKWALSPAQG
jgi:hypothetical protein